MCWHMEADSYQTSPVWLSVPPVSPGWARSTLESDLSPLRGKWMQSTGVCHRALIARRRRRRRRRRWGEEEEEEDSLSGCRAQQTLRITTFVFPFRLHFISFSVPLSSFFPPSTVPLISYIALTDPPPTLSLSLSLPFSTLCLCCRFPWHAFSPPNAFPTRRPDTRLKHRPHLHRFAQLSLRGEKGGRAFNKHPWNTQLKGLSKNRPGAVFFFPSLFIFYSPMCSFKCIWGRLEIAVCHSPPPHPGAERWGREMCEGGGGDEDGDILWIEPFICRHSKCVINKCTEVSNRCVCAQNHCLYWIYIFFFTVVETQAR